MSVTTRKYPKDDDKHLGLEIEFLSPLNKAAIAKILNKSKLAHTFHLHTDSTVSDVRPVKLVNCPKCKHAVNVNGRPTIRNGFIICINYVYPTILGLSGSTCNTSVCKAEPKPEFMGHELSVLFKEKDLTSTLKYLKKDLLAIQASVNKTCGLHVHLDMRERGIIGSYSRLVKAQSLLFKLVDKSRHRNSFCEKSPNDWKDSAHYSAINANDAFEDHNTIEVRLHHGSVNITEISGWIKLLLSIVDKKPQTKGLSEYIKQQRSRMRAA